jgi:hypothetical protein
MSANFGPCAAWPVTWVCDVMNESPVATGKAALFATEVIWSLSGRQFGACPVTIRPCRRTCLQTPYPDGWQSWPGTIGHIGGDTSGGATGWFIDAGCSTCSGTCSCVALSDIVLPTPVSSITSVKMNGAPLVSGVNYRLDENRYLARIDGTTWPYCQDLTKDDTQPNTWSVTFNTGADVPEGGSWAVGELACEFLKALKGEDCRLPRNVTNIARQGVTIQLPDPSSLFEHGLTGLLLADRFIQTWNPHHLPARSRVYSVDGTPHRRVNT